MGKNEWGVLRGQVPHQGLEGEMGKRGERDSVTAVPTSHDTASIGARSGREHAVIDDAERLILKIASREKD
jgi:hypothetical protein